MLKINKIINIEPFQITGIFNDGQIKKLDIFPIIQNHIHHKGVKNLLNESVFNNAQLGVFGEIFWSKIVESNDNHLMDYDISPEYFYNNGENVDS
ncbi:DUF2442 domain-containing protein [Lacihabitans sp. LS3-19]|uniref:DUF2442 domain-containing protein n=1 Tax=Lacihabitans sp. LS3-19 TaxID=2487335 RepID=UPI0020CDA2BA|nr:DUF2442 domain-containing protein [Lacihabitans sp. LS3-19]MCP9767771.1 DUF2442 domain-containing protein [Lacihabitans sp. LS3-19]